MRKKYLLEILQITIEQQQKLINDDYEAFIVLLEERQELLNKVEDMKKIHSLTEDDRKILLQIKEIDHQNVEEYNRQFEQAKSELKKLKSLKVQNEQYTNPYDLWGKGFYFDSK